jgi:2-polyprenyl-6-methoxyphenol hydroxylase-like FAD-dependent oxidoreductase
MKILINGAGIAGLTLAYCLLRDSHDVLITEKSPALVELRQTYGGMGWIIPRLLKQCGEQRRMYFDTVSQVVLPTWSWGRVVLIGDACHCASLVAGQGASLAMAGAYVLYRELVRSGHNVRAALARYERRLRPVVESKQRAGRNLAKWFVPDSVFRIELRDFLLRTSTWPVASRLIQRGVGAGGTGLFVN